MAVRKLADGKYQIDYYPEGRKGKRIVRIFYGTEAEAYYEERSLRRQHGPPVAILVNPTIAQIATEFLEWVKANRAARTYADMARCFDKTLTPFFGAKPISRLTQTLITAFKLARRRPRATNKELSYLSSLVTYAVTNRMAEPLPFAITPVPYQRPIPRPPQPEEMDRFFEALRGRLVRAGSALDRDYDLREAMLRLLWEAGTRWTETAFLRWEHLDWEQGVVLMTQTKRKKPRLVVFPETVQRILRPYRQPSGPIFLNRRTGKPYGSLRTLIRFACLRADVRHLHPHLLRHAFGTDGIDAEQDIRALQAVLGHSDIRQTEWYTTVSSRRIRRTTQSITAYRASVRRKLPKP